MVKLCEVCGRFHYNNEVECLSCTNASLKVMKNIDITTHKGVLKINGNF